jgi:hypothetical protein
MRTLGVVEHALCVKQGGTDYTWRMYDVGGAVWVPLAHLKIFTLTVSA